MQRYNQGFLKFGPMEQCSEGEWVKYNDVAEIQAGLYSARMRTADLEALTAYLDRELRTSQYVILGLFAFLAGLMIYVVTTL